jgi:hypothetical protein
MLSDDVMARLSALNCERGARAWEHAPTIAAPHVAATPPQAEPVPEDATSQLPAGLEVVTAWGRHWRRDVDLQILWPHAEAWLQRGMRADEVADDGGATRNRELQLLRQRWPNDVVLLDLETCGFAGSPIFLAGLLHQQDDRWTLAQLLARTYAEEKPLLQTLWSLVAAKRLLVTFNGKSFDWPMVHDRSTLHHLGQDPRYRATASVDPDRPIVAGEMLDRTAQRPILGHCDLLHLARRHWGTRLPDCRLQTLERHLCRRRRADDIPGREIPAAYHDFVRHGDAWLLRSVLHHNALDLITLLQLATLVMYEKRL